MNKVFWAVLGILLVVFACNFIQEYAKNQGQLVYLEPGLAEKNLAQANKANAEAAQINDEIRRKREQDDGITLNTNVRMITGQGITPAQQFGSVALWIVLAILLFPAVFILVVIGVWKLEHRK